MEKLFILILILIPFLGKSQDECSVNGFLVDCKTTPTTTYNSYETRTICQLSGFYESEALVSTNIYGSRTDKHTDATGFFYSKMIDGRWWVIDPEGYLNICRAVNAISMGTGNISKTALSSKYGNSTATWMTKTMEFLNETGFYCAGSWSTTSTIIANARQATNPLAYTLILNWMSGYGSGRTIQQSGHMGYPNDAIFVFEQGFVDYCENKAKLLASNKNDKNFFGYFSDNELPFYNNSLNKFLRLGKTSITDVNYLATKKWLADHNYTEADTVNSDIQKQFLGYVGETYESIVYNAIKKYDPNHMVLGPRVNVSEARNNKYFMQGIGKYVDILAVNYYSVWTPDLISMNEWGKNLGKPFMVTEFYTKGEDSGLGNTSGAGWVVKTQQDRGYAYQNYTLALLENKYCVGWHWFKYMDNDPTTPGDPSNIDGNKGLAKIDYEPYEPMIEKMKEVNLRAYNLIDYFDKRTINTVDIYPEADAYYKDAENHGTEELLGIKNNTGNKRETFLRFDLTGQSSNFKAANLYLSVLRAGDSGMTFNAEFVSDDSWTESSITMANHPNGVYEIANWTNGTNVKLDVMQPVLETIGTDQKLSIKLSAAKVGTSQTEYASRENSSVALRPRLEIEEKVPEGPSDASQLIDLMVDNKRIATFNPDVFSYKILVPAATPEKPDIQFLLPNSSMIVEVSGPVNIYSDSEADRTAKIYTTSADGLKHTIYNLIFEPEGGITSIGEFLVNGVGESGFVIYPNPIGKNSSVIVKSATNEFETNLLSISDLIGNIIFRQRINGTKYVLETKGMLHSGIYFISILNSTGMHTKKMIVN
jgi:hypothetical protein